MPRSKCGKKRPPPCTEAIQRAVAAVSSGEMSIRVAEQTFGVSKSVIGRHNLKAKLNPEHSVQHRMAHRQVFKTAEETALAQYLKTSAKLHYGLTTTEVRTLAFNYAKANGKSVSKWEDEKKATKSWLRMFRKRQPSLTLRKPEPTSLARATAFNKHTVGEFFANYKNVLEKNHFPPQNIWNTDETGCSTVQRPPQVFSEKGVRQVGAVTSAERGTNVSVVCAINAIGNAVPPLFVFPRKFIKPAMLKNAPIGSVAAPSTSGWSNEVIFQQYIDHFISHVRPTKENPHLLIMDNHLSHISVEVINTAKSTGLILLTIPPHTSHKLQPLDRTVFGPFKTFYNQFMQQWMSSPENAGKLVTIYEVAELVGKAYPKAFCSANIESGFRKSGIVPLNEDVFKEDEFLSSYVTDRPDPSGNVEEAPVVATEPSFDLVLNTPSGSGTLQQVVTPEMIAPYPKAQRRKGRGGRARVVSRVLTDTPIKQEIEENKARLEEIKKQKEKSKNKKNSVNSDEAPKPKKRYVRQLALDDSSEDSEAEPELSDSSGGDDWEDELIEDMPFKAVEDENILPGDYVLSKCEDDKGKLSENYVAIVQSVISDSEIEAKFLKKMTKTDGFILNSDAKTYSLLLRDVVLKLPPPVAVGGTARSKNLLNFPVDLSMYKLS